MATFATVTKKQLEGLDAQANMATIVEIAPEAVTFDDSENGRYYHDRGIEELMLDIAEHGQLQPVIGVIKDGKVHLVAGFRRLKAIQRYNREMLTPENSPMKVRVQIMEFDSAAAAYVANVRENVGRENLSAADLATVATRLGELGLNQSQAAAKLGVSPALITQSLKVLKLPAKVLDRNREGRIPNAVAYQLADLKPKERNEIVAAWEEAGGDALTTATLKGQLRDMAEKRETEAAAAAAADGNVAEPSGKNAEDIQSVGDGEPADIDIIDVPSSGGGAAEKTDRTRKEIMAFFSDMATIYTELDTKAEFGVSEIPLTPSEELAYVVCRFAAGKLSPKKLKDTWEAFVTKLPADYEQKPKLSKKELKEQAR